MEWQKLHFNAPNLGFHPHICPYLCLYHLHATSPFGLKAWQHSCLLPNAPHSVATSIATLSSRHQNPQKQWLASAVDIANHHRNTHLPLKVTFTFIVISLHGNRKSRPNLPLPRHGHLWLSPLTSDTFLLFW